MEFNIFLIGIHGPIAHLHSAMNALRRAKEFVVDFVKEHPAITLCLTIGTLAGAAFVVHRFDKACLFCRKPEQKTQEQEKEEKVEETKQ